MEITKENFEALTEQNNAYRKDIETLNKSVLGILEVLGLAENGNLKENVFGENSNALPELLKGGTKVLGLIMQSQVPVLGKNAEKELKEKFSFLSELLPIINKYTKPETNGN